MTDKTYIVATLHPWNIEIFEERIRNFPGKWELITEPQKLNVEFVERLKPQYIFFPHWSQKVDEEILQLAPCVCFHSTDVPYGRGGSPIQNLIASGHRETVLTALKMTSELDAGPVYLKEALSLEGLAEEIYLRAAKKIADMIRTIITENPVPIAQSGTITYFKRRNPCQSETPDNLDSIEQLFDHIRMLDAEGYPRAFLINGKFKFELSRPALRSEAIVADVKITRVQDKGYD